jgi:hypothetical protein
MEVNAFQKMKIILSVHCGIGKFIHGPLVSRSRSNPTLNYQLINSPKKRPQKRIQQKNKNNHQQSLLVQKKELTTQA